MQSVQTLPWYRERSVWVMLFLGFSAGIPILLIFGTLSVWLREAGVSRSAVTMFSWAVLGYSFKFVWAPLVDRIPLPILTNLLGRRRSWILLSQLAVIGSILLMASIDPQHGLTAMAIAAVCLGFSSATQDIVIDAYRIESAEPHLQAMLSSTYVAGYRIGMMVASAFALYMAEYLGSTEGNYQFEAWQDSYSLMAAAMGIGVLTTLLITEPDSKKAIDDYSTKDYLSFVGLFAVSVLGFIAVYWYSPGAADLFSKEQFILRFLFSAGLLLLALAVAYSIAVSGAKLGFVNPQMVDEGYVQPIMDFVTRYGKLAVWVLLLIGFYRVSDIVLGVITSVFYYDMGYTKSEIATVTKVIGLWITIGGSFIGGFIALKIGVMRALQTTAVLVVLTNLLFCWLATVGGNHTDLQFSLPLIGELSLPLELTLIIIADNLVQGMSLAAFVAFLSALTNVSFTATQYAIFSSVMTLFPKVIGGFSGSIVDGFGYVNFFLLASAIGVPIIFLIQYLKKHLEFENS